MNYSIRKREIRDCKGIAHVVTLSWNETYKGIVPDYFLKALKNNEKQRTQMLIDDFDINDNNQYVLEINNEIVGFINYGKSSDKQFLNCGEIKAIYVIKKYKGKGFGRKLVEKAIKEMKQLGYDKMIVACLKGNTSNGFYEHIGGKYIKDGLYKRLNLPENIYYYEI